MTESMDHHRLPTDTDDGLLIIISGPSGVGKTTITRGVERSVAGAIFSVSVTTRPKSASEVDGVDYRFIDDAEFERLRDEGRLLECAEVFGNKYATPRDWVEIQLGRGRAVILEIDVEGAKQVKAAMPEAFALFILPPSEDELLARLRGRKREDESVIQRRFAEAQREIAEAHASGVYDRFIVNDDVAVAIQTAIDAITQRRGR